MSGDLIPIVRFEQIRSKRFDISEVRLELLAEMNSISQDIIREYNKTASYWKKNKPKFTRTLETNVDGKQNIAINIRVDNKLYTYIDRGTSGRVIDARSKPVVIGGKYSPGSSPGTLYTSPGGASESGEFRVIRGVFFWPGVRARLFTEQIKQKVQHSTNFRLTERLQSAAERAHDKWWK
jgi:hypothetical protein